MIPVPNQKHPTADSATLASASAAILAAAIGCFSMGGLTAAAAVSKPATRLLTVYPPSGALSGESTVAVAIWLLAWFLLARRSQAKPLALATTSTVSLALLLLSLLLTFPPFLHLLTRT